MKIVLVTREDPGNQIGGLGTFIRDYAAALRKKAAVKIVLVKLNRPEDLAEEPPPSELVDVFVEVERTYTTDRRDAIKAEEGHEILHKLQPFLDEWRPDVIHINDRHGWFPFRHLPNTVFSLHLSMSDMVGLRGLDAYWFHELKLDKDACARAGALIVYSGFMREVVWDHLCDFASPIVLPLGFDPSRYRTDKSAEKIVISYFGRLENFQKGFADFLQAVDIIDQSLLERYDVEFHVYGKGEIPEWLPTRRVTKTAFLQGDELTQAYAESHVVVMPSRYEPFGLVGLEALASGCVLLCTEGLGMDEYLVEGKNYVPIKADPLDIKAKIEAILQSPGQYLGREGIIQKSVEHWTWERSVDEHMKVYHQIAHGRAPQLNWVHGKFARKAAHSWEQTAAQRKSGLGEVYSGIAQQLSTGSVLVVGATEQELAAYRSPDRELVPHSFIERDGWITFLPEYILVPPNAVDTTVFIYGIEYVTHFNYSITELLRVTKDHLILGISCGEKTFGQNVVFEDQQKLSEAVSNWLPVEVMDEQWYTFVDGLDNRQKEMGLFTLRKRSQEEIQQLVEERQHERAVGNR